MNTKEAYAVLQKEQNFKPGETVQITRKSFHGECGWEGNWYPEMNRCIGKTGVVFCVDYTEDSQNIGISVTFDGGVGQEFSYFFPWFVLKRIRTSIARFNPNYRPEPFERVLCKDEEEQLWFPDLFGFYLENSEKPYYCIGGNWKYAIPYEGNEWVLKNNSILY